MQCYVKVGEGGRLIIPALYRKALNLQVGDELILQLEDGELRLFRQRHALDKIRAAVKASSKNKNHTDDFLNFRKKDSE